MNTPSLDVPTFLSFVTWHETRASLASFARWNVLNLSWQWRLHFWSADATHTGRRACTRNKGTSFSRRRATPCFFCPRYSLAYTSLRYGEQRHLTPAVCSNTRQTWKNIYMTKTTDRQTRYQRNKSNGNANCPNEHDFRRSNCPANSLEMVHLQIRLLCFVYDQDSTIYLPKVIIQRSRVFRWIYGALRKWINWIGIKEWRRMKDKENDWNVCERWLNKWTFM